MSGTMQPTSSRQELVSATSPSVSSDSLSPGIFSCCLILETRGPERESDHLENTQ